MNTRLDPYISFKGTARQAMEFYHAIFGGKLEMSTFNDYNMAQNPADGERIMHAMLESDGISFMASDTTGGMPYVAGTNYSLSISGDNRPELVHYFERLSEGGQVIMPLEKAPWGDTFGMLTDRFGINWMVNIAGQPA
ncbi:MAG: VOC family protein [Chloroflexota bacterium]